MDHGPHPSIVVRMPTVEIREFTDPGCPFAFSAEPLRRRLDWVYGDQLRWTAVMIGLAETGAEYVAKGFTPDVQVSANRKLAAEYGMPIDSAERPRMAGTVDACRAVVAARLHAPEAERPLLRALRVRAFAGALLDDPATIDAAAGDAGLDPARLTEWTRDAAVEDALRADMGAARDPHPAALALPGKLASWEGGQRYTAPSYEVIADDRTLVAPGMQPLLAYEVLLANAAPGLERRETTGDVAEVLAWAGEPLATKEVAVVCELDVPEARERLARVATERPVGPDGYWSL